VAGANFGKRMLCPHPAIRFALHGIVNCGDFLAQPAFDGGIALVRAGAF
jgi:hypothetical protein